MSVCKTGFSPVSESLLPKLKCPFPPLFYFFKNKIVQHLFSLTFLGIKCVFKNSSVYEFVLFIILLKMIVVCHNCQTHSTHIYNTYSQKQTFNITNKNLIHQNASATHLNSTGTSILLNDGYNAEAEFDSIENNKFNNFWIIILVFLSEVQTFFLKVRYFELEGNILNN